MAEVTLFRGANFGSRVNTKDPIFMAAYISDEFDKFHHHRVPVWKLQLGTAWVEFQLTGMWDGPCWERLRCLTSAGIEFFLVNRSSFDKYISDLCLCYLSGHDDLDYRKPAIMRNFAKKERKGQQ